MDPLLPTKVKSNFFLLYIWRVFEFGFESLVYMYECLCVIGYVEQCAMMLYADAIH